MGPKRSKIVSISPGWGSISKLFCRVGIYSQSQVKKSGALKIILNMFRTVFSSSRKMSKGFSKFRASFPKLGRTKQGVDIENICHHLFQGQYICQTKRIQCWQNLWQKRVHVGSIMWNKKRFRIKNSCHKRHPCGGIVSNKKSSMSTTSLTWKALVLGASGFNKK